MSGRVASVPHNLYQKGNLMSSHIHFGNITEHEKLHAFLTQGPERPKRVVDSQTPEAREVASMLANLRNWLPHEQFDVTHVTDEGHLVLNIRDLFTPNGFHRGSILYDWAKYVGFDMFPWPPDKLNEILLEETLIPAVRELPGGDELLAAAELVKRGDGNIPDLPNFSVLVNVHVLAFRFLEYFEGPFSSVVDLLERYRDRLRVAEQRVEF